MAKSKKTARKQENRDEGTFLVLSPSNSGPDLHATEHPSLRLATQAAEGCAKAMSEMRVPGRVLVVRVEAEVSAAWTPVVTKL